MVCRVRGLRFKRLRFRVWVLRIRIIGLHVLIIEFREFRV